MKPRTPGFWLIVATVGLLALLPLQALAGMSPAEIKLFRETKAKADQGDVQAQNSLGLCYYFGRGVAKDYVQAVNLWRKGANQGDAYAQHLLAHRYATGEGIAKDSVQAVNLWRKSAAQGNAKAQFELGNCHLTGEGVVKDAVEAAKWYRKSADQGYAAAAKSLDLLNRKTPSKGSPPTKTSVTDLAGYKAQAEQGQAEAQYFLGMIYRTGSHGVARDVPMSLAWFTKSAEQGHPQAQYYVGRTYFDFDGNTGGVAKDTRKAVGWWRKAAAQGDADAQEALGFCFAKGFGGLVKNEVEAYALYELAESTNEEAGKRLATLEMTLSPEARLRGQQRTKELQKVINANIAAKKAGK